MGRKIIQWNCHSLKTNMNKLLLLSQKHLTIVCLQEILLKCEDNIKNYQIFNYTYNSGGKALGWGLTIVIRNNIPHNKINITNIQAIVINGTLYKTMIVCSLYIPQNDDLDKNKLKN